MKVINHLCLTIVKICLFFIFVYEVLKKLDWDASKLLSKTRAPHAYTSTQWLALVIFSPVSEHDDHNTDDDTEHSNTDTDHDTQTLFTGILRHSLCEIEIFCLRYSLCEKEGHDGPVSLHWLIREIHSYQTLHYLGIGLKHKTPYKD